MWVYVSSPLGCGLAQLTEAAMLRGTPVGRPLQRKTQQVYGMGGSFGDVRAKLVLYCLQGLDGTMYVEAALAQGSEKPKGQLLQKDPPQPDPLDESRVDAPLGATSDSMSPLPCWDCHDMTPDSPKRAN